MSIVGWLMRPFELKFSVFLRSGALSSHNSKIKGEEGGVYSSGWSESWRSMSPCRCRMHIVHTIRIEARVLVEDVCSSVFACR
jgi:hypothetical protein